MKETRRRATYATLHNWVSWRAKHAYLTSIASAATSTRALPSRVCSMFLFGTLGPTCRPIGLASKGAGWIPMRMPHCNAKPPLASVQSHG